MNALFNSAPGARPGAVARTALAALGLLLAGACGDRTLTGPGEIPGGPQVSDRAALLECRVDVRSESLTCAAASARFAVGPRADLMVGGQDMYVKLTSSGTTYDAVARVLSASVTVQNLTRHVLGSSDGFNVEGMRVFFHEGPTVTAGGGQVTVLNPDGYDLFTASSQPYFAYATMLDPMEISVGREWQFQLDPEVLTFAFLVYVAAPLSDEESGLLGSVWTGAGANGDWLSPLNWRRGEVPDSTTAVSVPPDAQIEGPRRPALTTDAAVLHLRVGTGSALDLGGNTLRVYGNVDAVGEVNGGTVRLRGSEVVVGGTLPTVAAEGAARLQRTTTVNGTLTVTGSLAVQEVPLTIVGQ